MKKLLSLLILFSLVIFQGCEPEQNYVYVPTETCSDGILNQGELETDCGGPCPACSSRMSAKVDGISWQAQGNITSSTNNGSLIILSGNGTSTMSIIYTGAFALGTYNLASAVYGETATQTFYMANGGSITFTSWDTRQKTVSGTFSFTGIESSGTGTQKTITEGVFKFVPYQ